MNRKRTNNSSGVVVVKAVLVLASVGFTLYSVFGSSFLGLVTISFFVWMNSFCSGPKTGFIFTFDSNIVPQKT